MSSETTKQPESASRDAQIPHFPLSEMLSREPSRVTRRFLHFLLLLFILGFLLAVVIKIDVSITAPAELQPQAQTLLIQPEFPGTLVEVKVREGQFVNQGDTLAIVAAPKAGELLFTLREKAMDLEAALLEKNLQLPLELRKLNEEIASLKREQKLLDEIEVNLSSQIEFLEKQMDDLEKTHQAELAKQTEKEKQVKADLTNAESATAFWDQELKSLRGLLGKGVASDVEVRTARRSLEESQSEVTRFQSMEREMESERKLIKFRYRKEKNELHTDLIKAQESLKRLRLEKETKSTKILTQTSEARLKQLESEKKELLARFAHAQARRQAELPRQDITPDMLAKISKGELAIDRQVEIKAPVTGQIGPILIRKRGELIKEGQTILRLLPKGPLVAELRIANRDIGLAESGQSIKLTLDAFPFADYGALEGTLTHIAPDAETVEEKPGESFYRATVTLDRQSMPKGDLEIPLLSGMRGSAEIVTERKTLLELILKPFKGMTR